jgi:hypothetical protein
MFSMETFVTIADGSSMFAYVLDLDNDQIPFVGFIDLRSIDCVEASSARDALAVFTGEKREQVNQYYLFHDTGHQRYRNPRLGIYRRE